MYRRILVAVENSPADQTILGHVSELARLTGASLLLIHVSPTAGRPATSISCSCASRKK
jgi:nucleotide-binding universal stress UspA family protein